MAICESRREVYPGRETERFSARRALVLWLAFGGSVWLAAILVASAVVRIF
jgi:hypothetical protein